MMSAELKKMLLSPEFWTSVLIGSLLVGTLASVLAAYIKPGIDGALSWVSGKWTTRSARSREKFQQRVAYLAGANSEKRILQSGSVTRLLVLAMACWQGGLSSFVIYIGITLYGESGTTNTVIRVVFYIASLLGVGMAAAMTMQAKGNLGILHQAHHQAYGQKICETCGGIVTEDHIEVSPSDKPPTS